jgi:hypothetical protein
MNARRTLMRKWIAGLVTVVGGASLLGCDADGKKCRTGEGVDAVRRWQHCNASCDGKDNAESCAAAKTLAAAACAESVKQNKRNDSACRNACENGDSASCTAK